MQYQCNYPGDTSWTLAPEEIRNHDGSILGYPLITGRETCDQQYQYLANAEKRVWSINPYERSPNASYSIAAAGNKFQHDGLPICQLSFGTPCYYDHGSMHKSWTACHPSILETRSSELGGKMFNDTDASTSYRSDTSISFNAESIASTFDGSSSPFTTRSECWSEASNPSVSFGTSPESTFSQWTSCHDCSGRSSQLTQCPSFFSNCEELTRSFRDRQLCFPAIAPLADTFPRVEGTISNANTRASYRENTIRFPPEPVNAPPLPVSAFYQDACMHVWAASGPPPHVTSQIHSKFASNRMPAWNEDIRNKGSLSVLVNSVPRVPIEPSDPTWSQLDPCPKEETMPFTSHSGQIYNRVTATNVADQCTFPSATKSALVQDGHSSPMPASRHPENKSRRLYRSRNGPNWNAKLQSQSINPATSICRSTSVDEYLLRWKRAGMTYKEIRDNGNYTVAESTLRGRYRNMTKERYLRVRVPKWQDTDALVTEQVELLKEAVVLLRTKNAYFDTAQAVDGASKYRAESKVPWKKVAEYISTHGGSYHFGNATCRKKWDSVNGL